MAKVAIVTGSTAGIGKYAAIGLAKKGYEVVITGRDSAKGKEGKRITLHLIFQVLNEIEKVGSKGRFIQADFSRFVLTLNLLDLLKKSAPARVVVVAAAGGMDIKPDLENLNSESGFGIFRSLGGAQACNDLFTLKLARELDGTGVTVNCLNPGMVDTGIRKELGWISSVMDFLGRTLLRFWFMTPEQGAVAPLELATSPEIERMSGALVKYNNIKSPLKLFKWAKNEEFQNAAWNRSVQYAKNFIPKEFSN